MKNKQNKFDEFFSNRKNLINQYNKGDLTKEEFIESNFDFIQSMNTKPFSRVDNIKKGIFNYQYYNAIAKHYQKRAHDCSNNSFAKQDFLEKANYFYEKKNNVTSKILMILDYSNIEAYYVKVKSSNLKNKLIEIALTDYEDVIFHTKSENIINKLIEERVSIGEKRESLVDEYINNKY